MVGFPYDALDAWRGVYPADVYVGQMRKVAEGFATGSTQLRALQTVTEEAHRAALEQELDVMEACAIHFESCANQARFVALRNQLASGTTGSEKTAVVSELESLLKSEIALAKKLYAIQVRDSRLGFEATNHYFYVPLDLVEKVINCQDLLDRWLPAQ